jgi:hypothetical protein
MINVKDNAIVVTGGASGTGSRAKMATAPRVGRPVIGLRRSIARDPNIERRN